MAVHPLLLQQFPLLRPLGEKVLDQLAQQALIREYAKREMVLNRGKASQYLCFLLEGRLQAIDFTLEGREVGMYFIEPSAYFGELSFIDGQEQPEFVIASEKAKVILLPSGLIRPLIFTNPHLAEEVAQRLASRVRTQIHQRQVLTLNNPLQRIAAQLQVLTEDQKSTLRAIKAPTHQELAMMVNLTRETVTRTLQVLQAKGILKRDGDQLIMDHQKLQELSQENLKK